MSSLGLQSSRWGRDSRLLYFCCCVRNVISLLSFCDFPLSAVGWSVVCECGISWSYSLLYFKLLCSRLQPSQCVYADNDTDTRS